MARIWRVHYLSKMTGTQMVHVPYKGAGPAAVAVLSRRSRFHAWLRTYQSLALWEQGKLNAYATN
jgi:tripartite-type tricarboxylate transporter receptor subunit TctC